MTSLNSKPPNVMAMWPFLDWVYIQGMKKKLGRTHTGQLKTIFNAELPISEISILICLLASVRVVVYYQYY